MRNNTLKSIWRDLFTSGSKGRAEPADIYVTRVSLALATVGLMGFGVFHLVVGREYFFGILELGGALAAMINFLSFEFIRNVDLARVLIITTVADFMFILLVTGGSRNTGILWLYVFPIAAYSLRGRRGGKRWSIALVGIILAVILLKFWQIFYIPYNFIELWQLLASVLIVAWSIDLQQRSLEKSRGQSLESDLGMREANVRLNLIIDEIDEGVITVDSSGKVVFLNNAAEDIVGWKNNELVGKNFTERVPMLDKSGLPVRNEDRPLYKALHGVQKTIISGVYVGKNGIMCPVLVNSSPIIISGKLVGGTSIVRNLTAQNAIDKAKNEFISLVSHQMRTPISAIGWLSELLLDNDAGELTKDQRDYVAKIHDNFGYLSEIINDMINVSLLELREFSITPKLTDLSNVAHSILESQMALLETEKDLKIVEKYDKSLPPLRLDLNATKIILQTLISNAIKYTPSKGKITIAINQNDTKLRASSRGSILIEVADTGYGIPRAEQSKVFTKLFRAGNAKKHVTSGTGLALYIVKALVEYVGGSIWFISEENKGSIFSVLLPIEGMKSISQSAEPKNRVKKLKNG